MEEGDSFTVTIEYPWKPPKCSKCGALGHYNKFCQKTQKKWIPKIAELRKGGDPSMVAQGKLNVHAETRVEKSAAGQNGNAEAYKEPEGVNAERKSPVQYENEDQSEVFTTVQKTEAENV